MKGGQKIINMKINFRKISAIAASLAMAGMTAGVAAAANYPAPFVSGGAADVAIVYGTGAGVSSFLDVVEAGNIQSDLSGDVTVSGATGSSTTGGDSILLERSSDKLNLGDSASSVFVTSVDDNDMPNLLADGTYTDDDNTEYDYTQKITLGNNLNLSHFSDSDYMDKEPTIGIHLEDDAHVLNYTLEFTTNPAYNASTMKTTTLTLMGKEYYVLDVVGVGDSTTNQNKITLLDSANSGIVAEGETTTIAGKSIVITYVSSSEIKLSVDGETTNSLAEGGTYKLSDGTYVGIKDIMYDGKDTGISKAEISVGTGKLELSHGAAIELNDDNTINEIKAFMIQDSSYKLDKIVLQWTTDDEEFVTPEQDLVMPGFESVKISMGAFVMPSEEVTIVKNSGSDVMQLEVPLTDGTATIDLMQANSTGEFTLLGKDSSNRLVTSNGNFLFFNETAGDEYFVVSWNSTTEAESYYLRAKVTEKDSVNKLSLTNVVTGEEINLESNGSVFDIGSATLTLNNLTNDGSKDWFNISTSDSGVSFNTIYTKEGLKVYLPYFVNSSSTYTGEGAIGVNYTSAAGTGERDYTTWPNYYLNTSIVGTTGHGHASFYLWFAEADKDGNLAAGKDFNVTLSESGTSAKVHVSAVDQAAPNSYEIDDSDDYEEYTVSDLATKTLYDTGGDQDWVTITYAGDQSYGQLYVTAPEATVTSTGGTGQLGDVLVKDSEVSSVGSKNLIVVGGSCINSAAATLVGGAYCGAMWTDATGVGSGQFLIKSYSDSSLTSKMALLVAGYEAADTVNAATYLRTQTVDTSKEYLGTSSTSATMVAEEM